LLLEIAVLDLFPDVVGDVRAQVIAPAGQLADRVFVLADIEEDEALDVVQILDPELLQLVLQYLQELAVQTLGQTNGLEIRLLNTHFARLESPSGHLSGHFAILHGRASMQPTIGVPATAFCDTHHTLRKSLASFSRPLSRRVPALATPGPMHRFKPLIHAAAGAP